jgi:NAD(P)-dependent dehydrogenase (short-subunit alcohol dehydrogenase family)
LATKEGAMSITSTFDLSGKVAVVTGGSRGLGLAIADGLAAAGAAVAIAGRKIDACERAAAAIAAHGGQASAHAFDAQHWGECDRLHDEVAARWGGAQILVNNVGKSPLAPSSLETSEALFDQVIAVNLRAAFRLSALFGAAMHAGDGGAIVNISSSGAQRPNPSFAPYAAAKAGLHILTQAFAIEYGPKVRVNTVMPGPFHTDATQAWSRSEEFARHAEKTMPMRRAGEPREIVAAALYLASDAASFTTGALLAVDGGHSIGK